MLINNKHYRTIWEHPRKKATICIIDQSLLPHKFKVRELTKVEDFEFAIKEMLVRGAPLIGVTSAYAIYIACIEAWEKALGEKYIYKSAERIKNTRPTAVNLFYAIDLQLSEIKKSKSLEKKAEVALHIARNLAEEDVENCISIAKNGFEIIKQIYANKSERVNILTHCNAGWLATVDWGTALAPIYYAVRNDIPLHIWVDETRPLNQGARLTAFELLNENIPHTVIADNTGGFLMQKGMVDLVLVGSDRTTINGDVANKIGTYLKALSAYDNNIPFYVCLPSSTIDWEMEDGVKNIPIEKRNPNEVRYVKGALRRKVVDVLVPPEKSEALNVAFDVTPARLVTGLITERGVCSANKQSIVSLFPEKFINKQKGANNGN